MSWNLEENVQRDVEKAQESIDLYGGHLLKAPNKYEIRTGVVVAARFADKLRRTAFAVFGGVVPREEIVRAVSELNKKIYEKLISMGAGKLDIVRITVEVAIEGGRLVFGDPEIELFVPHSEVQECEKKLAEIKEKVKALLDGI